MVAWPRFCGLSFEYTLAAALQATNLAMLEVPNLPPHRHQSRTWQLGGNFNFQWPAIPSSWKLRERTFLASQEDGEKRSAHINHRSNPIARTQDETDTGPYGQNIERETFPQDGGEPPPVCTPHPKEKWRQVSPIGPALTTLKTWVSRPFLLWCHLQPASNTQWISTADKHRKSLLYIPLVEDILHWFLYVLQRTF